jgi:uncharacterized CHY-type Zn-finger protein
MKKHFESSETCQMPENFDELMSKSGVFACDICHKTYTSHFYRDAHRLTHTDKVLKCELCEQEFTIAKNLAIHMMRHKGEKNYACHICGKRYFNT